MASAASGTPSTQHAAADLTRTGADCFDRKNFVCAAESFWRAYALEPKPELLTNVALAELNAGMAVAAIEHLRTVLRTPSLPADRARQIRDRLLPKAFELVGQLTFAVPDGSVVFVDGRETVFNARNGDSVVVTPGIHEVRLLDGRRVMPSVQAGQYILVAFPSSSEPHSAPTRAQAAPRELSASSHAWSARSTAVAVGAAVLVIAAGSSIYFAIRSDNDVSNLRRIRDALGNDYGPHACSSPVADAAQRCAQLADAFDAQSSDTNFEKTSLIVAGAAATGIVATLLFWPEHQNPENAGARVVPMLAAGRLGLSLVGQY